MNQITLSEIEWQIMQVIWEKGVLSVKEVWQTLYPDGQKAYTTIQTYLDRMVEKDLLAKQKIGLVNFYHARIDKKSLVRHATESLVSRAFNGSFLGLAAFLVESPNLSKQDLEKIKALIEKKEEEQHE
jgi:BlaI family penicillinase repressor